MNLRIAHYADPSELQEVAGALFYHQIYEQSGTLQNAWERIAINGHNARRKVVIVVAYATQRLKRAEQMVGALLFEVAAGRTQFYVKDQWRRQGVATAMLKHLRTIEDYGRRLIEGMDGYPGAEKFFEKNFVYLQDYTFTHQELVLANKKLVAQNKKHNSPYAELEVLKWRKREFLQKWRKAQKDGVAC